MANGLSKRAQGIADGTWHTVKKEEAPKVTPPKTIKPAIKPQEPKCDECGESPKDCECDDCDCDK